MPPAGVEGAVEHSALDIQIYPAPTRTAPSGELYKALTAERLWGSHDSPQSPDFRFSPQATSKNTRLHEGALRELFFASSKQANLSSEGSAKIKSIHPRKPGEGAGEADTYADIHRF